jgi:hypothetical protein
MMEIKWWLLAIKLSIRDRLDAIGNRLHYHNDQVAKIRGWTITKTQWGLGRIYRNPQFEEEVKRDQ